MLKTLKNNLFFRVFILTIFPLHVCINKKEGSIINNVSEFPFIKVLNRVAYGYRNFIHYKKRMMIHFKFKAQETNSEKIHFISLKKLIKLVETLPAVSASSVVKVNGCAPHTLI